jgi:hypothetical protein
MARQSIEIKAFLAPKSAPKPRKKQRGHHTSAAPHRRAALFRPPKIKSRPSAVHCELLRNPHAHCSI